MQSACAALPSDISVDTPGSAASYGVPGKDHVWVIEFVGIGMLVVRFTSTMKFSSDVKKEILLFLPKVRDFEAWKTRRRTCIPKWASY